MDKRDGLAKHFCRYCYGKLFVPVASLPGLTGHYFLYIIYYMQITIFFQLSVFRPMVNQDPFIFRFQRKLHLDWPPPLNCVHKSKTRKLNSLATI